MIVDLGGLQLDAALARRLTETLRAGSRDEPRAELTTRELDVLRLVGAGKANSFRFDEAFAKLPWVEGERTQAERDPERYPFPGNPMRGR